MVLSAAIWNQ